MAKTAGTKLKTKDGFDPSMSNYSGTPRVKGFVLLELIDLMI